MSVQLTYDLYQAAAFKGMLADSGENDILSYAAEAPIEFAKALVLGTDKERQVLPASTSVGQGALVVAFAASTQNIEQTSAGLVRYETGRMVNCVKVARLWVETEDAVVAGATANLVLATGKLTDAAVGAGIEAITQLSVKFLTGTTGAGLAVVQIREK